MNHKIIQFSMFCFLLFTTVLAAQAERPRIALVLSGGGARGFAHVGVLKWFEEHRIPVDMIAGTSMGGLVGGMYSIGMTTDELEAMIARIDWYDLFRPLPKYDTLSFRRKEDRRRFPNSFELGLKNGISFPPGVNPGHAIGLLLDRYTLAYSEVNDFDQLPIRFRCIATDMVEAKQVILGKGSLATALQATMAIPGVFYPVEIDGHNLASDGGLLNNVPTDVAEVMGADIIIAVDIGTPLGDRKSLNSLGGMLSQTISVAMAQNIRNNLDKTLHPKLKVVISPDLQKYTTFSFANSKEITDLGYQGAEQHATELESLALTETEYAEHIRDRQTRLKKREDVHDPEFVSVTGTNEEAGKTIAAAVQHHVGTKLDSDSLDKDLSVIWGRGRYAGLGYTVTHEEDKYGLLIHAREKGYAPPFLNVGLEINNTQTDVFDFNLRARVTLMDLKQQGAEWRFEGSIGSELLIGAEYYKLLGSSRFFVSPSGFFQRTKTGVFSDQEQLGEYQIETESLGIDLGYNFNSSNEMRLGYFFGHKDGEVRVGDPQLPEGGGKFSVTSLRWTHDSTDSAVIPTRGARIFSNLTYNFDVPILAELEQDQSFTQGSARASVFLPVKKRNTLVLIGEGATTFDKTAPIISKFHLGGLLSISAASRDEFFGDHVLYGNVGILRQVGTLPYLIGEKISAGIWYEIGSAYDDWDQADMHQSISGALIAETFLGPVFIGLSFGDEGRNNFFFALGRVF